MFNIIGLRGGLHQTAEYLTAISKVTVCCNTVSFLAWQDKTAMLQSYLMQHRGGIREKKYLQKATINWPFVAFTSNQTSTHREEKGT